MRTSPVSLSTGHGPGSRADGLITIGRSGSGVAPLPSGADAESSIASTNIEAKKPLRDGPGIASNPLWW
ncbi:MAG: hypothetical protein KAQ96_03715 [Thermoplasmata archaeon]|nr:hypothetical protein [Thermoplasmata archaeon]